MRSNKLFSHVYIEKPAMFAKLPDLQGKHVLCVGCGSGEECNNLTDRGAKVVGIDSSNELIKIAQQSYPDIDFQVMDMEHIDLAKESFDFIYSSLTLHYKAQWGNTLASIATAMKDNATFLFSTLHPLTWAAETIDESKRKARLFGYEQTGDNIIVHGDYFTPRLLHDKWWGFFDVDVYVKPLMNMLSEIREAKFDVIDFVEPKALLEGKQADPIQYARYEKLPLFMIFALKKRA